MVGVFEAGKDFAEFVDGLAEWGEESVAIFDEDFGPHVGVSGGDAGGIAEAAAAEAAFGGVLEGGVSACGGEDVGEV
jgi:hypothetical protein